MIEQFLLLPYSRCGYRVPRMCIALLLYTVLGTPAVLWMNQSNQWHNESLSSSESSQALSAGLHQWPLDTGLYLHRSLLWQKRFYCEGIPHHISFSSFAVAFFVSLVLWDYKCFKILQKFLVSQFVIWPSSTHLYLLSFYWGSALCSVSCQVIYLHYFI